MLLATILNCLGLAATPIAVTRLTTAGEDTELIHRYLAAVQLQSIAQKGVALDVTFEVRVPTLNRQATLRALRSVSSGGQISYEVLDSSGDAAVRREVIARYLAAESQERDTAATAVTPSHYRFHLLNSVLQAGRNIYIFQITPKKNLVGLFKGELWVDGQTGLPVHESGQFVKSPSRFLKRVVFTRDYDLRNGMNIPIRVHSTVISRIAGRIEMDIYFSNSCQLDDERCEPADTLPSAK